ncbi:hypothetical protein PR202_ga30863 [Eleusine coracana subsp. coracana]|uniref:ACT domain-containing protein ACR n=1 Tax=Eleusine coracana subsp. coracana TaxID=191504 RepID=A0AAV5DQH5_ELECO|nr:hypothetical protein PR202_ga30863 [Eleusine coracana subsp. coracana]
MEWLDEYEKLVIRMNTPARGHRQWRLPHRDAGPGGQLEEARGAPGGGAAGRRQRDLLHPAVSGLVGQPAGPARGPRRRAAHGAGADGRRPHGPAVGGVRRAGRHGLRAVADARAWTHRGRLGLVAFLRDGGGDAAILARLGHLVRGDGGAVTARPAADAAHADRRLHQLMAAELEMDDKEEAAVPTPAVSVESWAERGYSVVTVRCRDRPKLLFDVACTLHDMDYVVFHGTVDTAAADGQARQEFYVRHADGSPIRSKAESHRVSQCIQAAIERRSLEGVRLELCTPDRPGLLSDVTRTFRENGLLVAQAEVSTKGDVASNVFYVTDAAGNAVDQSAIDAVRERVGVDCLVVREEPQPQLFRGDRDGVGGVGLVYLGNLVKRNLYNLGLIKSCS